jgi:hypothetical protein
MDTQEPEERSGQSSGISAKVRKPDQRASVSAGTGQENTDEPGAEQGNGQGDQQDAGQESRSPRLVERMTGLRALNIACGRVDQSTIRKRTERDLRLPDAEIPYGKTEKAVRDLVCSLMERQDRMNEAIFLKLNDLEYRVDDIEQDRKVKVAKRSGADKAVRK